MKKTVIILDHGGGSLTPRQLANQLWMFISVYAYSLEKSYKLKNYSFYDYYKYFKIPIGNFFVKLIFFDLYYLIKKILPPKKHRPLSYYHRRIFRIFVDYLEKKHQNSLIIAPDSNAPIRHYLPPSKTTDNTASNFDKNNNKNLYLDGWMFRNPEGLKKYHKEIIDFIKPRNHILKQINSFLGPLQIKYKNLVGIHYRQGDYKKWKNGKYFLTQSEVYRNLFEYIKNYNIDIKNTCFVICSDEDLDLSYFSEINIVKSNFTNPVLDLFLLASTDAILGSNSTFGAFASYYGNIPMIVMQKNEIDWDYYIDKKTYFEDKYCSNVWY